MLYATVHDSLKSQPLALRLSRVFDRANAQAMEEAGEQYVYDPFSDMCLEILAEMDIDADFQRASAKVLDRWNSWALQLHL